MCGIEKLTASLSIQDLLAMINSMMRQRKHSGIKQVVVLMAFYLAKDSKQYQLIRNFGILGELSIPVRSHMARGNDYGDSYLKNG
jgi:hypothetical protein